METDFHLGGRDWQYELTVETQLESEEVFDQTTSNVIDSQDVAQTRPLPKFPLILTPTFIPSNDGSAQHSN